MIKLKMLQNKIERIEYMLNTKIILCFLCPLKALNYIELNILNTHNLVYKMHNAHKRLLYLSLQGYPKLYLIFSKSSSI